MGSHGWCNTPLPPAAGVPGGIDTKSLPRGEGVAVGPPAEAVSGSADERRATVKMAFRGGWRSCVEAVPWGPGSENVCSGRTAGRIRQGGTVLGWIEGNGRWRWIDRRIQIEADLAQVVVVAIEGEVAVAVVQEDGDGYVQASGEDEVEIVIAIDVARGEAGGEAAVGVEQLRGFGAEQPDGDGSAVGNRVRDGEVGPLVAIVVTECTGSDGDGQGYDRALRQFVVARGESEREPAQEQNEPGKVAEARLWP